jgi:hypothetical protein
VAVSCSHQAADPRRRSVPNRLGDVGFKASAWEIGVMAGPAETGLDLRSDDSFLGTSAGARENSLAMVAVNVESGERRAFDRHSGVELVDAVMATTAF